MGLTQHFVSICSYLWRLAFLCVLCFLIVSFCSWNFICILWGLGSRYYFREALCLLLPVFWRTPNLNSLRFKNSLVSWIWVTILYVDYTIVKNSQRRFRYLFKIYPAPESRQPNFRGSLLQVNSMCTFTLALWSPSFMGKVLFLNIYIFSLYEIIFFQIYWDNLHTRLYRFRIFMIWYTYILWNDCHNKVS